MASFNASPMATGGRTSPSATGTVKGGIHAHAADVAEADSVEVLVKQVYSSAQGKLALALERKQEEFSKQQESKRDVPEESGVAPVQLDFLGTMATEFKRQQKELQRETGFAEVDELRSDVERLKEQLSSSGGQSGDDGASGAELRKLRCELQLAQAECSGLHKCKVDLAMAEGRVMDLVRQLEDANVLLSNESHAHADIRSRSAPKAEGSVLQSELDKCKLDLATSEGRVMDLVRQLQDANTLISCQGLAPSPNKDHADLHSDLQESRSKASSLQISNVATEARLAETLLMLTGRERQLRDLTSELNESRRKVKEMNAELAKVGSYLLQKPRNKTAMASPLVGTLGMPRIEAKSKLLGYATDDGLLPSILGTQARPNIHAG